MIIYEPGTRVAFFLGDGKLIEGTIVEFEDDIKNGLPGYSLTECSDGVRHWTYAGRVVNSIPADWPRDEVRA